MHAEVTSFGLKWANYYAELVRGIALFAQERKGIEACKMSGAVGNYANVDPFVQDYVAEKFHLRSADISTQVLSRDFHERYASELGRARFDDREDRGGDPQSFPKRDPRSRRRFQQGPKRLERDAAETESDLVREPHGLRPDDAGVSCSDPRRQRPLP
jgi:hypothetical protein